MCKILCSLFFGFLVGSFFLIWFFLPTIFASLVIGIDSLSQQNPCNGSVSFNKHKLYPLDEHTSIWKYVRVSKYYTNCEAFETHSFCCQSIQKCCNTFQLYYYEKEFVFSGYHIFLIFISILQFFWILINSLQIYRDYRPKNYIRTETREV